MLYITDEYGMSVEGTRDPAERLRVAKTLIRRASGILRDLYSPQVNDIKRELDSIIRTMDR